MFLNSAVSHWPAGEGTLSTLVREADWNASPLGPVCTWPKTLRSAIDLMLPADVQFVLFWGPDYLAFYNDAYRPSIGNKHPAALGQPAALHWTELWHDLEPLLAGVRKSGKTFSAHDRPFHINRNGYLEQVFFDVSYSAVRGEEGDVAGVMCVVNETTQRVLADRSLAASELTLREEKEFTRLLLDSTTEGFYAVDCAGITTLCNAAFLRMLGYASEKEVLGRNLREEIHHSPAGASHAAVFECPIYRTAQTGLPALVKGEVFSRKDGSQLSLDCRVAPIWRDGQLQGAICTFVDTRERMLGQALQKVQKKTASDLRESHDQLRLAQEAGGIGVFLLDVQTNIITPSAEFCRLFGLPLSDALQASQTESLVEPETVAVTSSQANRRSGEAALNVEYRIKKADTGELRWISRRAEFVRNEAGKPLWMRGVVQDVTECKNAEATLRDSEARFRALAQAIPNQVWTASPDGQLDWFNQKALDYGGLPEAALVGNGWTECVHPEDRLRIGAEWQRSLEIGQRYETEFRIRRRDGVYRWHLVRALPLVTGGKIRWLGANTDIEDQKALQQALSELSVNLEQRVADRTRDLDRMWRLSTDLILICGSDGLATAANPAWEKLLGWELSALIGMPVLRLVHKDDMASTLAKTDTLAASLVTQYFENRCRHKDGSYRVISWVAVPDNGVIHAVGRDVSAEREAAQALLETQERLRQSQKMEALGQLTGGIAHDFNNLLHGISGSIDVVRRRLAAGRSDDIERFMDAATHSASRAAALIHRLLAFARRQSLDSRKVEVSALVMSMEELLRRTLGAHISLDVLPGEGVWAAQSDENQLESAVLNLAINARDAMPGGGTLSIATSNATLDESYTDAHEGLQAGDYAVISVSDSGTGMPPDVLAKVFEPFFTTKPQGQGTGLGLSMIYGFAKQSGGHVRLQSAPGEGTTVWLYLPRDASAVAMQAVEIALPLTADALQGEGETILLVEDDAAVRMIVLDELGELGYTALEAVDGPSAITLLRSSRKIDLLLTDVALPGMNGRQVAELARQHRPQLRVLFMTGYAENAAARSDFLAPGMAMISKPFAMDDLAVRIREMLNAEPCA